MNYLYFTLAWLNFADNIITCLFIGIFVWGFFEQRVIYILFSINSSHRNEKWIIYIEHYRLYLSLIFGFVQNPRNLYSIRNEMKILYSEIRYTYIYIYTFLLWKRGFSRILFLCITVKYVKRIYVCTCVYLYFEKVASANNFTPLTVENGERGGRWRWEMWHFNSTCSATPISVVPTPQHHPTATTAEMSGALHVSHTL